MSQLPGRQTSHFPLKILLATDGSEEATLAAQTAADLTSKTDSELHVVLVESTPVQAEPETFYPMDLPTPQGVFDREQEALDTEAARRLRTQLEQIEATGCRVAQAYLREGVPDQEIVSLAREINAGMIVIGSRGLGRVKRVFMGSISDSVVRHAHCPVLVVR
jgi:nucleotide-binding universal stress UspA family protein